MKFELESSPLCSEVDILSIIIDNEASDSIDSGIVPGDSDGRSMREALSIVRIINEFSHSNVQVTILKGCIAHIDGVDLSDGGN